MTQQPDEHTITIRVAPNASGYSVNAFSTNPDVEWVLRMLDLAASGFRVGAAVTTAPASGTRP